MVVTWWIVAFLCSVLYVRKMFGLFIHLLQLHDYLAGMGFQFYARPGNWTCVICVGNQTADIVTVVYCACSRPGRHGTCCYCGYLLSP